MEGWTLKKMLEEALRNDMSYHKGILILLDDKGQKFDVTAKTAGIRLSDAIALVELIKHDFIEIMRGGDKHRGIC